MADNNNVGRVRLNGHLAVEEEIGEQALEVARAQAPGIVDGVYVDFRHSGLPGGQTAAAAFLQAKHELRTAEKLAAASARNLARGPESQRDQEAIDFAKAAWKANPLRKRQNIAKELAERRYGVADENSVRAIMRTLRPHDPHLKG